MCRILGKSRLEKIKVKKKLELFTLNNIDYINQYYRKVGRAVGLILPNTRSAERYIQLAVNMRIINQSNNYLELAKRGKVIQRIINGMKKDNPFKLSWQEIFLYLKYLLLSDSIYFYTLLNLLPRYNSLVQISMNFRASVISMIKELYQITYEDILRNILLDIESWRHEKKYIESIVPPRLYWLYDLKLVELYMKRGRLKYKLKETYKELINGIKKLDVINIDKFIENNYVSLFYKSYISEFSFSRSPLYFRELTENEKRKIIKPLIDRELKNADILPSSVRGIIFSIFAENVSIHLLNKGIICEIKDFRDSIKKLAEYGEYYLYWDSSVNDGIIRKV